MFKNKLSVLHCKMKTIALITIFLFSVEIGRSEILEEVIFGPNLTIGYEYNQDSYLNLGFSLPFFGNVEDGYAFKFKPNASFDFKGNQLYSLGLEWFYGKLIWHDADIDFGLLILLLFSSIGIQNTYHSEFEIWNMEPNFNLNLWLMEIVIGYSFPINGRALNSIVNEGLFFSISARIPPTWIKNGVRIKKFNIGNQYYKK